MRLTETQQGAKENDDSGIPTRKAEAVQFAQQSRSVGGVQR